jgi:hypothetical protein
MFWRHKSPRCAIARRPQPIEIALSSSPSRTSVGAPLSANRKTAFSRSIWPAISSRYLALKPISSGSCG